jgi:capsular exopolysaccharide synthesis family protein
MGKVYDALKMSGSLIEDGGLRGSGAPRVSAVAADPEPEDVNYLDYLLNGIPVSATDAPPGPGHLAPAPPKPVLALPRAVALDTGRIDPRLVAFSGSDQRAVEQYNRLAVALISAAPGRSLKRILIGSAARGEGRTTVALNLAYTLARARKRVLLVDADLLRPSILRMAGVDGDLGLGDIFQWKNPGAALLTVARFGFDLLPTRRPAANSAEILSSRPFNVALDLLEPHYDFILFDTPPLLEAADSNLLMKLADTMVMVIGAGKLKTSRLAKAVEGLKPEDVFGVVLNRARPTANWSSGLTTSKFTLRASE